MFHWLVASSCAVIFSLIARYKYRQHQSILLMGCILLLSAPFYFKHRVNWEGRELSCITPLENIHSQITERKNCVTWRWPEWLRNIWEAMESLTRECIFNLNVKNKRTRTEEKTAKPTYTTTHKKGAKCFRKVGRIKADSKGSTYGSSWLLHAKYARKS